MKCVLSVRSAKGLEMLNPEEQADLDQKLSQAADSLPLIWWRLYENCLASGFNENQSLELVKTHILSIGGIRL